MKYSEMVQKLDKVEITLEYILKEMDREKNDIGRYSIKWAIDEIKYSKRSISKKYIPEVLV